MPKKLPPADTRTRILDAAEKAFARAGWLGATTQEIARAARVNEVTLFRHFGNKEKLFASVIGRFTEARRKVVQEAALEEVPLDVMLGRYAEVQRRSIEKAADFLRTAMAEIPRHPAPTKKLLRETVRPLKTAFLELLQERQRRGEIRPGVNCEAVRDLFMGTLFAAIFKPCLGDKPGYPPKEYYRLCVEIFVRGLRP